MRYKFYREHKYVSAAINDVERLLAKTDFTLASQRTKVKEALSALLPMLKGHAEYENSRLHKLLRDRGSNICEHVEEEHREYEQKLKDLKDRLAQVLKSTDREEQIELGYQLYLWFRKFAGDNLLHLHEEETVILPELQRLYSDEELCQVEFESYQVMSSEDLIQMLEILFPHMNADDKLAFLTDIKSCDEKKFLETWKGIKSQIEDGERKHIESKIV
jgi:hemerythrin-like domain-containing protein